MRPLDAQHIRQTTLVRAATWLDLPPSIRDEMRMPATPSEATARHWLSALTEGWDDDPGDLHLHLALLLAHEMPSLVADPTTATRIAAAVTGWATRIVTLTGEERSAHVGHLLRLASLIDPLPKGLVQEGAEKLWHALAGDNTFVKRVAERSLALLPAHLDAERIGQMIAATDTSISQNGITLAAAMGERAPVAALLAALRRDSMNQWEAAKALIALGDAAPLPPLLDIAAHHPNPHMRSAVLKEMGALKDRVDIGEIVALIRSNKLQFDANVLLPWADRLPIDMVVDCMFARDYALTLLLPSVVRRRTEVPLDALRQRYHSGLALMGLALAGASARYTAAAILLALGEKIEPLPLIQALARDPNGSSLYQGVRVLLSLGDDVPTHAVAALLAKDNQTQRRRIQVAEALTRPVAGLPLSPLLGMAHEDDPHAQRAGIIALRGQGARVPRDFWQHELGGAWPAHVVLALAAYDEAPPPEDVMGMIWRLEEFPSSGMRWGGSEEYTTLLADIHGAWGPRITPAQIDPQTVNLATVRTQAARVLGAAGTAAALDALLVGTRDPDALVRETALRGLGTRAPMDALQRLAEDPERTVREAAIALLGQSSERPLAELLAKCHAPQRADRVSALLALGHDAPLDLIVQNLLDDRQAIDLPLLDLLVTRDPAAAYDAVMAIRQETGRGHLRALAHLGARAPVDLMVEALYDEGYAATPTVAVEALLDCGQVRDDTDPQVLAQIGEVLASALDEANKTRGRKGERDHDRIGEIMPIIERLPPQAGMALLTAFARGDTEYRFNRPPVRFPDASDYPRIITKTLTSREEWVRWSTAIVLLRWRGRLPLAPIIDALRDLDDTVRQLAAWLLGKVGDASAIPSLRAALSDGAAGHTAGVALGRLGVTDVDSPKEADDIWHRFTPPLDEDAEGGDAPNRDQLVWLVGERWATDALDALSAGAPAELAALVPAAIATLEGKPTGVFTSYPRILCATLLRNIHADAARFAACMLDLLDWPHVPVRVEALQALPALRGPLPEAILARVHALLHDADARVRVAAEDAVADLVALQGEE